MINGHLFKNYLGLPGAGKTLSALEENLIERFLNKQKIVSNFFINLKGIEYYSDYEFINFRNCVLFIDEIGQILDPYNWKELPYEVRRFFQNHRKYHVDIISTTQDVSFIAKPARVLITEWVYCENNDYGPFVQKILSWFNYGEVRIKQQSLSTYELEKLQKGLGANPLVDDDMESDQEDFSDDLDLSQIDVKLENPVVKKAYSYKRLKHIEFDDVKIELVYRFCPLCCSRQGAQIPKDETFNICDFDIKKKQYFLKSIEYCPNHPEEPLILKESGLYDTDFLVEPKDVEVEWRPYVPIRSGALKVPFKGALSTRLIQERSKLPKSVS